MNKIHGVIEDLVIYKSNGDIYKGQQACIPSKVTLGTDSVIDTNIGPIPLKHVFNV